MIPADSNESISKEQTITFKIARRPVRHYQIIQFNISNFHDYNFIISSIAFITKTKPEYSFVFYILNDSIEYTISNEDQWEAFISNNFIKSTLFNKPTLKIEYDLIKPNQAKESKLKQRISSMTMDSFLSSIIDAISNDQNLCEQMVNSLNQQGDEEKSKSKSFSQSSKENSGCINEQQTILIDKFTQIKTKIEALDQIKDSLLLSTNYEEEGKVEETNKDGNVIKCKDNLDLPTFDSFYNCRESKSTFHTKLVRDTLPYNFDIL